MARFSITDVDSFFFQPLQLHLQPPDLLVQFRLQFFAFMFLSRCRCAEDRRPLFQQLPIPVADLSGMHAVFLRELVDRLGAFRSFQRYLEFETGRCAVFASLPSFSPPHAL